MLRFIRPLTFALMAVVLFTNCRTAQKYVERGDYDGAIDFAVNKLAGKKKKKTELVQGLELAFRKATERDMRAADALIAEDRPDNWERVNDIHRQIQLRQEKVAPLIPLTSKDGYTAKFLFVNIEKLEADSRAKAAAHLYDCAQDQLAQARNNHDRAAARAAYRTLCDLENRYFKTYEDKDVLKREARQLGITHVLFEVKNESDKVLPREFNDRVLAIGQRDLDSEWKQYHFAPEPGVEMDYRAVFRLRRIDISPERVYERTYTDENEIQDGWEYVYDQRGNVQKDSAGNDIKHKRYVIVRAQIIEVHQSKAARLTGQVEVLDARTSQRVDSHEVGTEVLFDNYASTFTGDERALSKDSRSRIGNRPVPFPSDEALLVQAADRLKPSLRDELRRSVF